jgi:hypothetical protein
MQSHEVIYLKSEMKSFSWRDGLHFIQKEEGDEIYLVKIKEDGTPSRYEDGCLDVIITGKGNKGITKTNLTISV